MLTWAAVDAWEIRGLGRFAPSEMLALEATLAGVILRTRPSAVVVILARPPGLLTRVQSICELRGLPVVTPSPVEWRALRRLARTLAHASRPRPELIPIHEAALRHTAELALAALALVHLPPRRYAVSRFTPRPTPRVDAPGARRPRSS